MTTAVLLAYNPNDVRPGWGALVLVLVLLVVTYLLWRSMNTQLGRIKMPPARPPDTRIPGSADAPVEPATDDTAADDPPSPPSPRAT